MIRVGFRAGCNVLVWSVDILDGDDGQITVISEVTKRDAGVGPDEQLVDHRLGHVEADGYAEEVPIGQPDISHDSIQIRGVEHRCLCHTHPW